MSPKAVVIDPDELELDRLVKLLESDGYWVDGASESVGGLIAVLESFPNLIVLAEENPNADLEALLTLLWLLRPVPIVVVIGNGGVPREVKVVEQGADAYLGRPVSDAVLLARTKALLRLRQRYP